jgi:hypothetical protein
VLVDSDKSVDDISKKAVGTFGPNTSVIAPGETPLVKKALEKPSAVSNQQGKKLAKKCRYTFASTEVNAKTLASNRPCRST